MIKQKDFIDSQGINFRISYNFFQKLDLCVFVNFKIFSTDTLGVNFEVLNLYLYMDYCEFALSDEAKVFSWLPGDKFLNFILFFRKLDLIVFVDLENFSTGSIRLNFEVLKLLHLCMDCHEDCFKG